jgi:hypothetical protein
MHRRGEGVAMANFETAGKYVDYMVVSAKQYML